MALPFWLKVEQGGYLSQLARWVTGLVTSQSCSFGREPPCWASGSQTLISVVLNVGGQPA